MNRTDTSLPEYFFHQGTNFHAYDYLGCHLRREESGGTPYVYVFRTWAPNASEVRLVSDFTDWSEGVPLERVSERGVWECEYRSAHSLSGSCYKFRICGENGIHLKGDPYAFASEGGDRGASRIPAEDAYEWQDAEYLDYRRRTVVRGRGNARLFRKKEVKNTLSASDDRLRSAFGSFVRQCLFGRPALCEIMV